MIWIDIKDCRIFSIKFLSNTLRGERREEGCWGGGEVSGIVEHRGARPCAGRDPDGSSDPGSLPTKQEMRSQSTAGSFPFSLQKGCDPRRVGDVWVWNENYLT